MPKVYIIILNYCGAFDTISCLESVFKISYLNYHIILIDNCSPDNSIDIIQNWATGKAIIEEHNQLLDTLAKPFAQKPIQYHLFNEDDPELLNKLSIQWDLTIIKAKSNRGFSAGNNLGLSYAKAQGDAEYYWLLNNDTLVTANSLNELVKCHQQYQASDKIGIVGGKLLYYNEPNIIQCLGGGIYNELLGFIRQVGDGLPVNTEHIKSSERLDYISGACMLVKPEFVYEVGLLAEDYFFYYEELDWCARGRKKGWGISYTKNAIIYHKVGASVNANYKKKQKSEMSDYYSVRSKLLYASKYNGLFTNFIVRLGLLATIANRIFRGQFKRIFTIVKLCFAKY
ncbi:glycosyltransferase family 2 protein [Spirosoma endophyticum]|uniref:Glycosyltransferase 2-like domain-containing protein n=1 Tax=Spirosoma endophyticum TaxID=662367 RepID=A0A1I1TAB4_9BACT|nr:glycosyltransferase family 2 protein [Spirosoma endophyticum]SFD55525.1 hypothetical protein SAMN05216167_105400 [Spirosoma endophyticum]